MSEDRNVQASTHGSGQSVVTIINDGAAKWLAIVALAFVVAFCLARETELADTVAQYRTEARLAQYQSQELRDTMIQKGIQVPPDLFAKDDKAKAQARKKP